MRVKLKERRQETPDIMTFVFDLAGQRFDYTAGQFAYYELDALTADDPRGNRRHFTISASPTEHGISQITTKSAGLRIQRNPEQRAHRIGGHPRRAAWSVYTPGRCCDSHRLFGRRRRRHALSLHAALCRG